MSEHILEIRHLSKTFGSHAVLKDIDFKVVPFRKLKTYKDYFSLPHFQCQEKISTQVA